VTSAEAGGDLAALQGEVAQIRDARAVEALKHSYTNALDSDYDLDAIGALFTPDARWVADGFGDYRGRDEILAFFEKLAQTVVQVRHFATSPLIEVAADGMTATGQWNLLCLCARRHRDDPAVEVPVVEVGTYRDTCVKVDGRWYFAELSVEVVFSRQVGELVRTPRR
jgi:uncharacterized protein (TIGR02246 family)